MELEELKTIWQNYDSKLDNLEKLNKKLILETLSKKPQKKLNWMKYKNFYSKLFWIPVVLIFKLNDYFRIENIDLKFIIGWLLTIIFVVVICYINFRGFMVVRGVDLSKDSVIESGRKVTKFKRLFVAKRKFGLIAYPIIFAYLLLISNKGFVLDSNNILILIGVSVLSIAIGYEKLKIDKREIEQLEKDIHNLKEYEK